MGALLLGTVANGRLETNERGPALLLLRLGDSIVDSLEIAVKRLSFGCKTNAALSLLVTVIDMEDLPSISKVALLDILGERDIGITIDGDV